MPKSGIFGVVNWSIKTPLRHREDIVGGVRV
jgi:hypothetical protein